jgi:hypothetical protein
METQQDKPIVLAPTDNQDRYGVTVDSRLDRVMEEIYRILCEYIAFPMPSQVVATTLWIVHTYVFEEFDSSPILAITSAEKRSGKTRLLDVLEHLVSNPWRTILPSDAVVYRKIEASRPTMMLDEADAIFGRTTANHHEGLRALLNSGNRQGTKVPRTVGSGTEYKVVDFEIFCPKAIAGIGTLPETVMDRSISIRIERRASDEIVVRFHRADAEKSIAPVRDELLLAINELDSGAGDVSIPDELDDRAADCWEPLLTIADWAGGRWPEQARIAAIELSADREAAEEGLGHVLLSDIRLVFEDRDIKRIHTVDLIHELKSMEDRPWAGLGGRGLDPHYLAKQLKNYGVAPTNQRILGENLKGYSRADFENAWKRYVPAPSRE